MNTFKIASSQRAHSAHSNSSSFLRSNQHFLLPSPETERGKAKPRTQRLGIRFLRVSCGRGHQTGADWRSEPSLSANATSYWFPGAPPPEQGGRFGVKEGGCPFPAPLAGLRSVLLDPATLRPRDPASALPKRIWPFPLGPKPLFQRRPFSGVASGRHEAAAAAPPGDLAVRGWAAGQLASLSCLARGL